MAQKIILVDDIGEIIIQKRKGARSIRLSVNHDGEVKVSIPIWSPYKVGVAFVISKLAWIKKQQLTKQKILFSMNDRIGKSHRLYFVSEKRETVNTRVSKTEIVVKMPLNRSSTDDDVQKAVQKAAIRALKAEANILLPGRLHSLAVEHGFKYNSISIKHLKTRWGSCSSTKEIALNCFLMQLPWDLIDYVLLHELLHTQIMAHGKPFWDELGHYVYNLPDKRRAIRAHRPSLIASI